MTSTSMTKSYSELMTFSTFEERYEYLKTTSVIGEETFGHSRYLNQAFYTSEEWRSVRDYIIGRDLGMDLGMSELDLEFEIAGIIIVHHINPITEEMILNNDPMLYDPENLICCSDKTHKAIHYGDRSLLPNYRLQERRPGDTTLWS